MKSWLKSKTLWVNFAVVLVGGITTIMADAPLDAETQGLVLGALGAINMFLRSITTTALTPGDG